MPCRSKIIKKHWFPFVEWQNSILYAIFSQLYETFVKEEDIKSWRSLQVHKQFFTKVTLRKMRRVKMRKRTNWEQNAKIIKIELGFVVKLSISCIDILFWFYLKWLGTNFEPKFCWEKNNKNEYKFINDFNFWIESDNDKLNDICLILENYICWAQSISYHSSRTIFPENKWWKSEGEWL